MEHWCKRELELCQGLQERILVLNLTVPRSDVKLREWGEPQGRVPIFVWLITQF